MILDSSSDRERHFVLLGAVSGLLTVALGAFGAHALDGRLSDEQLEWFHTAVRWQGLHALAMIGAGLVSGRRYGRFAPAAGWLFALGTVVFCGSLYLLAFTGVRTFGAVTPIGGVLWLAAWSSLALSAVKRKDLVVEIEDDAETVVRTAR
ncbi:MAG: DUF423 domain-containing protein [Candidatus Eiseniibacteriota bacterium]